MMDLVQQIESYSPQTNQPRPNPYSTDPSTGVVRAPLIDGPQEASMDPAAAKPKQEEEDTSCTRFFKQKFYKEYFKVTEADVLSRIKSAVVPPFKEDFLETIQPNPDFYGPLWIHTTLIFLLGTVGNISNYIYSKFSDDEEWDKYFFELELVRYAFVLVYAYAAGVPVLLYFALKFLGAPLQLPQIICAYGYANICFIIASILSIFPITFLQWILFLYAFANSTLFLVVFLRKHLEGNQAKQIPVLGIVAGAQFVLFLCCMLIFIDIKELPQANIKNHQSLIQPSLNEAAQSLKVNVCKKDYYVFYTFHEIVVSSIIEFVPMQSLHDTPPKEKVKYQLIYQSIQEKLNQILQSNKCSLNHIRQSSQNSSHRDNDTNQSQHINRLKTCKKVMFQPLGPAEPRNGFKRHADKPILKTKKSIMPQNIKTSKSLHCSITKVLSGTQHNKSYRSIRNSHSQFPQIKRCTSEILQKLAVFFQTQIAHKQIIEWLQAYCSKERAILLKLFLRAKRISSIKSPKIVKHVYSLQLDEDVLNARLETKLKDGMGVERYVNLQELQELSQYLEKAFIQKMKIKAKEFEETIALKMRSMCQKIRKENDNEYRLNIRKKPIEISQFLVDVNNFENNFGTLKKINTLHRTRFKVLNDTDEVIHLHARQINSQTEVFKKHQSVSIFS